jgi:cystathionine gamma-synthase
LLRIVDLEAVAALCRRHQTLLVADNTFLSPALQQPLSLGADLVVHSTTKYLNGHSDVVGGAVVAGTPELAQEIDWWANCLGLTGAPFDSYLTLRGVRTLHARLRIHEENAHAVADLLDGHPAVARVFYPGLAQHPGHTLARRQQKGFGGMISFELRGGASAAQAFVEGMTCFSLAESLGGVESLVAHPATMTHAAMDEDARLRAGIGDGLIRLSIGIEAAQDLVADVAAGLERASSAATRPPLAVAAAC